MNKKLKSIESVKRLRLPRLLIEAVLIFSSVYAAFLLEDKRSKRFERALLQQKLMAHLKVMDIDSITFGSRLLGTPKSQANEGLKTSIEFHKEALELLETRNDEAYLKVYELHKSGKLFWRIIQSVTKSQHKLEVIKENYDHLIINDSTRIHIEKYIYHTWVINQFAANSDQYIDDLHEYARNNFFIFSPLENRKDIISYVSSPYYYNSLKEHLNTLYILLDMRAAYFRDLSPMRTGIINEIELQKSKL